MNFATLQLRFAWFGAEANSWGLLATRCERMAREIESYDARREDDRFDPVFEAYDDLESAFLTATDGDQGVGFGVGRQLAEVHKAALIEISYEYASRESENTAMSADAQKMIQQDKEDRA